VVVDDGVGGTNIPVFGDFVQEMPIALMAEFLYIQVFQVHDF
jgi:hypothetical protein